MQCEEQFIFGTISFGTISFGTSYWNINYIDFQESCHCHMIHRSALAVLQLHSPLTNPLLIPKRKNGFKKMSSEGFKWVSQWQVNCKVYSQHKNCGRITRLLFGFDWITLEWTFSKQLKALQYMPYLKKKRKKNSAEKDFFNAKNWWFDSSL